MANIINPTEIRKRLLANGYKPLPAIDKRCVIRNWSKLTIDEDFIDSYARASSYTSTALRLDAAIMPDVDVRKREVREAIEVAWAEALPMIFDNADVPLMRRGTNASNKVAYLLRAVEGDEAFSSIRTARFMLPGATTSDDAEVVEIFSGSGRFMGGVGPHAVGRDGVTISEYVWTDDSPLDVPFDQIPQLSAKQADALCASARQVFLDCGYTEVKGSASGRCTGEWVYTLTEDMAFDCLDGTTLTLAELKAAAKDPNGVRCSAGWLEGLTAVNRTRCIAHNNDGRFFIVDFATMDKHMEKSLAPGPLPDLDIFSPAPELSGSDKSEPGDKPKPGNVAVPMAAWIRANYGFYPASRTPVVPLNAKAVGEGAMSLANFRILMLPYDDVRPSTTPGGKPTRVSPVTLWTVDAKRVEVAGYGLRPDLQGRLYSEAGKTYINTYHPPVHDAQGGSAAVLIDFMEQLAPKPGERKYFLQWLAHKFRYPWIPGAGIIMVAPETFGTGRGRFTKLLGKLWGSDYVQTVLFHMFAGSTQQGKSYNGYEVNNLIVVVDEAQQLDGHSKRSTKADNSAVLRERIDPEARMKQIVVQGIPAWKAMVYASYIIMTNSYDIFKLVIQERRCFVLTNGGARDADYWMRVNASIENPADVAAFAEYLLSIDLSDFNPYETPLLTEGKATMAELSKSDIDIGLEIAMEEIGGKSELFTMQHVLNAMALAERTSGLNYYEGWESIVRGIIGGCGRYYRVSEQGKTLMFKGIRTTVYSWAEITADKWRGVDKRFVIKEFLKAGPLVGLAGHQFDDFDADDESGTDDDR